jgi:Flp pilus assembly protein TadG
MGQSLPTFCRSKTGSAAVEFAFIMPILLAMFAGVVEIGRIFQVYNATNRLATQFANVYADCSDSPAGTCSTELSALASTSTISNIVPQLDSSHLSLSVFQVSMSGTTPTIVYASPSGATLTAAQTSAAQALLTSGQPGVVVTATYTHSLQFFQTLMNPYLGSLLTPSYTAVQLKG